MYFCGFNAFQQFQNDSLKITEPTQFKIDGTNDEVKCSSLSISWSYNIFAFKKEILVSGFVKGETSQFQKLEFDDEVAKLSSNDKIALILLQNGKLFKLILMDCTLTEINFLAIVETEKLPQKRSIFGEPTTERFQNLKNTIEHIACGVSMFIAITKSNEVYSIPSKIYEFPKHLKVSNLVCGFEHSIILTTNGDVYSWGNGLRGQLGVTDLEINEVPNLVEALSGVKIICIAAGGWHSAAISAFGDLYVWGSNVNGQLGAKLFQLVNLNTGRQIKRKNPTVFPLPQLTDIMCSCCSADVTNDSSYECTALKVYAGARHTLVEMSCGKIYCTGWNEYGQLGINAETNQDSFVELKLYLSLKKIICGPWSTVFVT